MILELSTFVEINIFYIYVIWDVKVGSQLLAPLTTWIHILWSHTTCNNPKKEINMNMPAKLPLGITILNIRLFLDGFIVIEAKNYKIIKSPTLNRSDLVHI